MRPSVSKAVPALTLAPNLHPQGFIRAPRPSSLPKNPTPAHPNRHPSSQAAPAPSPGSQQPLWLPRVLHAVSRIPRRLPTDPFGNPATSPATSPRRCHRQPCQRILPGRRPAHRLPCRQHCHCRHPTSPPPLQSVTLAIPTPATPVCPPKSSRRLPRARRHSRPKTGQLSAVFRRACPELVEEGSRLCPASFRQPDPPRPPPLAIQPDRRLRAPTPTLSPLPFVLNTAEHTRPKTRTPRAANWTHSAPLLRPNWTHWPDRVNTCGSPLTPAGPGLSSLEGSGSLP